VEHIRMGLLDLIQQDDRVRLPAHGFRQLAALVVAHIAGRCPYQTADAVALHIFTHIDAHHGIFVVEEEVGQRTSQLGFAHAGRAKEEKRTDRPLFVLQTGARTANGIRDRFHSLILTDHTFVELSFQMHQLLALTLQHFSYRNAGPARDNFSDIFTFYFFLQHGTPFLDFSQFSLRFLQVRFQLVDGTIPKLSYFFVVYLAYGHFRFITRVFDGLFQILSFMD